jgi:hypothetical protein
MNTIVGTISPNYTDSGPGITSQEHGNDFRHATPTTQPTRMDTNAVVMTCETIEGLAEE